MDTPVTEENTSNTPSSESVGSAMQDYYQLQQELLVVTVITTGVVFGSVWTFYSLNTALNYLLGACTGVVYLKMLARDVARLGNGKKNLGVARLGIFAGLIILSAQLEHLEILPAFLGFMTYKAALIIYVLRTSAF